jgi:hypothetical protein
MKPALRKSASKASEPDISNQIMKRPGLIGLGVFVLPGSPFASRRSTLRDLPQADLRPALELVELIDKFTWHGKSEVLQ